MIVTPFLKQGGRVLLFNRDKRARAELAQVTGLPVVTAKRPTIRFTWDGHNEWLRINDGKPVRIYRDPDEREEFDSNGRQILF